MKIYDENGLIDSDVQEVLYELGNVGLVKIPMEGQLESLNAAVSAALLMYESRKNKRK